MIAPSRCVAHRMYFSFFWSGAGAHLCMVAERVAGSSVPAPRPNMISKFQHQL